MTITTLRAKAREEFADLFQGEPLARRQAQDFLDTLIDRVLEVAEAEMDEELGKHTCYSERKDNSPYETGVVDGHRCARDTAVKAFASLRAKNEGV